MIFLCLFSLLATRKSICVTNIEFISVCPNDSAHVEINSNISNYFHNNLDKNDEIELIFYSKGSNTIFNLDMNEFEGTLFLLKLIPGSDPIKAIINNGIIVKNTKENQETNINYKSSEQIMISLTTDSIA